MVISAAVRRINAVLPEYSSELILLPFVGQQG